MKTNYFVQHLDCKERYSANIQKKLARNSAIKSVMELEEKKGLQLHSNGESGWPSGVLQEIFSFCEWKDLLTARLVCKDWFCVATLPSTWFPFFLALCLDREAAQHLFQLFQRKSISSFLIMRVLLKSKRLGNQLKRTYSEDTGIKKKS